MAMSWYLVCGRCHLATPEDRGQLQQDQQPTGASRDEARQGHQEDVEDLLQEPGLRVPGPHRHDDGQEAGDEKPGAGPEPEVGVEPGADAERQLEAGVGREVAEIRAKDVLVTRVEPGEGDKDALQREHLEAQDDLIENTNYFDNNIL